MFQKLGHNLQTAWFSSIESTGCVSTNTRDYSSDEDEEVGGRELSEAAALPKSAPAAPAAAARASGAAASLKLPSSRLPARRDAIQALEFHHVEFWCSDASNAYRRLSWALGMPLVALSDQSTGNQVFCSYVVRSGRLAFAFTAAYSSAAAQGAAAQAYGATPPALPPALPPYDHVVAKAFSASHGLAVRAIGVRVRDVAEAYRVSIANGAASVARPTVLSDGGGWAAMAEVAMLGDVVLRFVSLEEYAGPFLPGYREAPPGNRPVSYGLLRLERAVAAVPDAEEACCHLAKITGFHTLPGGIPGATWSSSSSRKVLANSNEEVLFAVCAPGGTPKSPPARRTPSGPGTVEGEDPHLVAFLRHNEGPGVCQLSLESADILATCREMSMRADLGGLELEPDGTVEQSAAAIAEAVRSGALTRRQLAHLKEQGIAAEREGDFLRLSAVTGPIGDRPTLRFEIVQRLPLGAGGGGGGAAGVPRVGRFGNSGQADPGGP